MKKTLVLALCLVMALCATAFAATAVNTDGTNDVRTLTETTTLSVFATYAVDDDAVYNIDLAYGTFATTYTAEWNGDRHVYDLNARLTITDSAITVVNHTNRNITATVSYADNAEDGVSYDSSWSKTTLNDTKTTDDSKTVTELEAANVSAYGDWSKAAAVTYTFAIDDDSVALANNVDPRTWTGNGTTTGHQIGTVTLTLAATAATDVNP